MWFNRLCKSKLNHYPLLALIDNLNDTRAVVTRSRSKTEYFESKSLFLNTLKLSPYSLIL